MGKNIPVPHLREVKPKKILLLSNKVMDRDQSTKTNTLSIRL